jgi:DNA polymerase-1
VPVHVPTNEDDLRAFMEWAKRQPVLAFDCETTGLDVFSDSFRLRTVQFGTETEAWVILWEWGGRHAEAALWVLRNAPALTGHNVPYDALVLDQCAGVKLEDLFPRTRDTRILAALIDPRQPQDGGIGMGLKPLSAHYIDPSAPDTQGDLTSVFRSLGLTKATGWAGIELTHPTYLSYAGGDVILTARLRRKLEAMHQQRGVRSALTQYEHELSRMGAIMTRAGLLVDMPYVETLRDALTDEEATHNALAARYGVDSVNSTAQVAAALTAMGEELRERTASGNIKVDKAVLLALADLNRDWERVGARTPNPRADAVIRSKRASKWRTAYADKFATAADARGYIHPSINTLQARTGRMSISGDLAAQTLPSSDWMIRRAILADPGHVMISTDFQAVEMRVLAALAGVRRMREGFVNGGGDFDIHMYTAQLIKGAGATKADRKVFKGAGFGKVYGGGVATIARQTGASETEISRAVREYDRVFPEIKRASERWQREARAQGAVTITATGRYLPLDRQRMYAVVNFQCQSVARDLLGQAMINCEAAGLLPYMKLPIHDEIVASVPRSEADDFAAEFKRCMTMELSGVPITAKPDIGGRSWGSLYGADY